MTFETCLFSVPLRKVRPPGLRALALLACSAAMPCAAASLLPGETLCGTDCETLTATPQLGASPAEVDQPLWPPRPIDKPGGPFLGDFTPSVPPFLPDDMQPGGSSVPDDDSGTDTDGR